MQKVQNAAIIRGMKIKAFFVSALFLLLAASFSQTAHVRFKMDSDLNPQFFSEPVIPAQEFAEAALTASGAGQEKRRLLMQRLDALWQSLSARLEKSGAPEENAEKILSFMYEKILSKYNFDQTRLDQALESGVYNCVSSAVLFMHFSKRAGIPVLAVETPRHAFCVIFDGEKKIDVETTNPYGVNPGKKRTTDLGSGRTKYITVPAKDYAGRHQVDDRRAIGMIYNNRIVQLQKKKLDAQTVGLAVDSYFVQGKSQVSKNDLELCVSNAAANLSNAGKELEAINLLESAEKEFGQSQRWTKSIFNCRRNHVLKLVKELPFEEGLSAAKENREKLLPADYAELKEYAWLLGAQKAGEKMDWPLAVQIAERGLKDFPQSKKLLNCRNIFTNNYAADFHNAAADLFNSGKKGEAVEKIKEGLKVLPQNKILLSDLDRMSR